MKAFSSLNSKALRLLIWLFMINDYLGLWELMGGRWSEPELPLRPAILKTNMLNHLYNFYRSSCIHSIMEFYRDLIEEGSNTDFKTEITAETLSECVFWYTFSYLKSILKCGSGHSLFNKSSMWNSPKTLKKEKVDVRMENENSCI